MPGQQAQTGPQIEYGSARRIPANFCNLKHTNEEFIIDFGLSGADPTTTKVDIDTSVVVSPYTAKKLMMSLGAIVSNWEQHFGEIQTEIENRMVAGQPTPLGDPPQGPPTQEPPPGFIRQHIAPVPHQQFRGATPPVDPGAKVVALGNAVKMSMTAPDGQPPDAESDLSNSPCIPADFDQILASGGEPTISGYILWVHRARAAELEAIYSAKFTELLGQPVRVEIGENFVIPAPDVETSTVHVHILFATLFVAISLVPALMMEEKRTKTLDALLVSPASAGQVVLGKALAGLFYVALIGGLFFALNWAHIANWGLALLAFLVCVMFSIGLALAMGSFVRSKQHMVIWMLPVIFVLIIPAFFSQEPNLAPGLKTVFSWLPTSALVRLFQFSLSSSTPLDQLLTNLAIALVSTALVFTVVVWKVRRSDK